MPKDKKIGIRVPGLIGSLFFVLPPLRPAFYVEIAADDQGGEEDDHCDPVDQIRGDVEVSPFEDQEMDVGGAQVLIPKQVPDLPVPVRAEAIAPAVPDTQEEP